MTNLEWISKGNTGCTFATLFSKNPEEVGWYFMDHETYMDPKKRSEFLRVNQVLLLSITFPKDWDCKKVRNWCKNYYWFEEEDLIDSIGLRYLPTKIKKIKSWVQYFGADSHVPTRQSPQPMIMYTRKLNPLGYFKQVGFNGILHLAHAFAKKISEKVADVLWNRSFEQTSKIIGHKAGPHEAAKVTWLKSNL